MKTLTMTAIATVFALSSLAHAHPELGPEVRVVASPAQVTPNTYEREISARSGRIPKVVPTPAQPHFAGYQEINPKVGVVPPFFRDGRYLSDTHRGDRRWFADRTPRTTRDLTAR